VSFVDNPDDPASWRADVVVHSATKYIGGHGTAIGGVIIDSGRFDYGAHPERFPNYNQTDPGYLGNARVQLLRDLGSAVAPFNAWLIAQGLETLSLRIERHSSNALAVARWLERRPEVLSVNDAGLESSSWFVAGRKYAPFGRSLGIGALRDLVADMELGFEAIGG
jgi:O-acetylhomoserine (thiol)-lyase